MQFTIHLLYKDKPVESIPVDTEDKGYYFRGKSLFESVSERGGHGEGSVTRTALVSPAVKPMLTLEEHLKAGYSAVIVPGFAPQSAV